MKSFFDIYEPEETKKRTSTKKVDVKEVEEHLEEEAEAEAEDGESTEEDEEQPEEEE